MTWGETRDCLVRAGAEFHEIRGAGGRALVTPIGARVMAVSWDGEEINPMRVNPELETWRDEISRRFVPGGGMGGDFLWLSPEYRYFWTGEPRTSDFANYEPPAAVDPGAYQMVSRNEQAVTFSLETVLPGGVRFRLRREISLQDTAFPVPGIKTVGLRYRHDLELLEGPDDAQLGLWSVLQVPQGSVLMVPTNRAEREVVRVVGDPCNRLTRSSEMLSWKVTGDAFSKIGIPADLIVGRVAAWQLAPENRAILLVREFPYFPNLTYGDALVREQIAQQAVQIFDGLGFGEIENHSPTLDVQHPTYSETTLLWAVIGESGAVRRAAKSFLQTEIAP